MSIAMRQARYAVGDPGLFGFLGNVAKVAVGGIAGLATGGPLGAAAGILGGLKGTKTVKQSIATAGMNPLQSAILTRTATPPMFPSSPQGAPTFQQAGGLITTSRPGTGLQVAPTTPQGTTGVALTGQGGVPCTTGYHRNKGGYWTKRYGYIEKGAVCVRNRRRNPLNPRALSRAMSRVKSAQRAVKCLQLFAGPAARASAKGGGKVKRSCGGRCKR